MDTQQALRLAAARRYSASGAGRRIRLDAKLSLQEIADAIGVSNPTISRWENGLNQPRGEAGALWARLLADLEREMTTAA